MKKLFPILLAVLGLAIGTGAGFYLKPEASPAEEETTCACIADSEAADTSHASSDDRGAEMSGLEYVKLNNQFVVPIVKDANVVALVVMSLSIETTAGGKDVVYKREPKLQDAFLQALFDHANAGGFNGSFTSGQKMNDLRGKLLEAATRILGDAALNVLVIGIVRQDL